MTWKTTTLAVAGVLACAAGFSFGAEPKTWVRLNGTVYGARPGDEGPIGGGAGYSRIVTKGDYTATDPDSLLAALSKARAGQVVFIPGETEIDLTARVYIEKLVVEIPAGVTLAGNRGQDGSRGALLLSGALKTPVLIRAAGPDIRVTGLRIRGPNPRRCLDHHRRSFGKGGTGRSYYYRLPTANGIQTDHPRLTVDNCDIAGFSHAGIDLAAGDGHRVRHNVIHHCQYNGLGYGVCHNTASSTIAFNRFNHNRHSIAGTGRPGCGYVARNNVEEGVSLSHCFDMHGGRDRKDGTDIAGTSIEIANNTFRAPQTPVKIRGVPQERCGVRRNWFQKHGSARQAVRASEKTVVADNAYGPAPREAR